MKKRNNSGQALVLILLVMAVIITIATAAISRSISDVSISSSEGESQRAFSAAEAGIEKALLNSAVLSGNLDNQGTSYTASVSNLAQGLTDFVYPKTLLSGDAATIWFVSHDPNNNDNLTCSGGLNCFSGTSIKMCWGLPGTSTVFSGTPALELSVFYTTTPGVYSTSAVARAAIDPYVARSNSFDKGSDGVCTISGTNFQFSKTYTFASLGIPSGVYNTSNGLQFARIKMLYNVGATGSQPLGVSVSGGLLPSQGKLIQSSGTSGDAQRKVQVSTLYSDIPPVFDYAIFSPGSLSK